MLYSGTVGGVIEGVLKGVPWVAFSYFEMETPEEYLLIEKYIQIYEYI